jgi:hypothetical protein
MNVLLTKQGLKPAVLASLLALMLGPSARAGLYQFYYNDSSTVPQQGSVVSFEHILSGIAPVISSVEIILTFNDNASLSGTSSGIQGHLNLGLTGGSPFVNFYPVATSSLGSQRIYDVTVTGAAGSPGAGFDELSPNNTWSLVLWDNSSSGIENHLVGWSLDITAVPEPAGLALRIFGGVFGLAGLMAWLRQRLRNRLPKQAS